MMETLAAAVLDQAGWSGETPLYDPCCGSGTLLWEAYLRATGTPSAFLRRRFGFERLPDFQPSLWKAVREQRMARVRVLETGCIRGSDIDEEAVRAARRNGRLLDPVGIVRVQRRDLFDIEHLRAVTIVTNPPYGIRMGRGEDLGDFYKRFGDFLKQRCTGSTAFVYFGDRRHLKHIGLRTTWKRPLSSGGLDGRLARFDLY
jgi:putative N6-adenine-specific DNA methylase